VAQLQVAMRDRPYLANRTLAVLRKMFTLAERWHLRPRGSNPAAGHDSFPERKDRGARLTDEQLAQVGRALAELETERRFGPLVFAMLRLNMLTGWRPIEVRQLCWEDVDLDRRVVTLREAKTGTRSGFLGKPAAAILAGLPRVMHNPYCFPGRTPGKPLQETKRLWLAVHERAGLPETLRLYDLVRHTFNTVAQEVGVAPEMVQVLVGHVPMSISARYTHFALARTLEAADLAAEAIQERLERDRTALACDSYSK
jgi:integrase